MSFETTYKLSQNTLDFIATQFKTMAEDFFGLNFNQDTDLVVNSPYTFYADSDGLWSLNVPSTGCAFCRYQGHIVIDNTTLNTGKPWLQDVYFTNISENDVTPVVWNYYFPLESHGSSLSALFDSYSACTFLITQNELNYDGTYLRTYTSNPLFIAPNGGRNLFNTKGYFDFNDKSKIETHAIQFRSNLKSPPNQPTVAKGSFIVTELNGYSNNTVNRYYQGDKEYKYYYDVDNNYLMVDTPDAGISFNDLLDFYNGVLIPYLSVNFPDVLATPGIYFPTVEQLEGKPFAYISPIHELNYNLEIPDTSDYLDVSVISEPLSVISDTFDYLWSNIVALGFAPVLGFCLIATLIIRGLRGD